MSNPKPPVHQSPRIGAAIFDRGLRERLGRRQFSRPEIQEVLQFFGTLPVRCVYCGAIEVKRWDHLVSIRSGGETVLGNMVPSCGPCDDSKAQIHFETWMRTSARLQSKQGIAEIEERIAALHRYMNEFGYIPIPLEDRLTAEELLRLEKIRAKLSDLRAEADSLVEEFKARTAR